MARIYPGDLLVHAKLDTGAENSSLGAENIHLFRRKGKRWVRFDVTNHLGQTVTFERRVRRRVRIRQHNSEVERRWVVKLGVCIGEVFKEVEVNIDDRSDFDYPLLVGRSFLDGDLAVDSSARFTTEPECQGASQR